MSKKIKQISYLSAIMISIGSTVGAGIFFKNGSIFNNVGGSLGLMIASWLTAAVGIIALGLALIEMSSASERDGGIIEWARKFMPKKLSKFASSYMLLIYLPLTYLAMPLYVVNTLQDAIQSFNSDIKMNWIVVASISFALFLFVAFMDWLKHHVSEMIQIVISWSKFIPLLMVLIFGIYATSQSGVHTHVDGTSTSSITAFNPWLGILASIPAILFAYDGFYSVTSLKSDLNKNAKLGPIMIIAISVITAIYVVFGSITGMTGQTSFFGFVDSKWALFTINMFIMFAVFAILNGYSLITYRLYYDVYKEQPLGIVVLIGKLFRIKNSKSSAFYASVFITTLIFFILMPMGAYGFDNQYGDYGSGTGNLYTMADMLTNYTSLMAFGIITASAGGALVNRRTNKIKVDKKPYFVVAAWISIIFAASGGIYMIVNNIAGMTGLNGADVKSEIIKFIILIVTLTLAIIPVFFHERKIIKAKNEVFSK